MLSNALILHYVLAVITLVIVFLKQRKDFIPMAFTLIALPFFSWGIIYYLQRSKHDATELPDWLLRKEAYEDVSLSLPDKSSETNMISLQDALILNTNQIKRKTLMNILKNDFLQQAPMLAAALKSEDNETSHYAATALQQAKTHLSKQLRHLERELEERPEDPQVIKSYLQILKQIMDMEFLDRRTQMKYAYTYLHALANLIDVDGRAETIYHVERIQMALSLGEYEHALQASDLFLHQHPTNETAYFEAMAVHYAMKNVKRVHEMIHLLRSSEVRLSPDGLNQLRFWI
ncbi:MAG: hypothetical protein F9K39_04250 [Exiguobacterium chiriqhucha]|uniref:Uncharacterized protein n=1 Tax=Exiguobacterium chiriqhucha RW-2 TaxID=1345023 RepID=U1N1C3_9BACL|nr:MULTISPECIES: bacterial transcriptional activator domain-containing protein [Exiguobacterium]ERG67766.1 hypothetical protein M467_10785 [Exiguobacterium chiriqhucha RW-2]KAB2864692.1 MAG: hypothetical protein F9K39_04250 [Exiguobacterium chiriqhucha]